MTKREIARRNSGLKRYVIRIYKAKYCLDNYNDEIYREPEKRVEAADILVERAAGTVREITELWEKLLRKYEGYTYCVKDIEDDLLICGGVFDPNDIEYLDVYRDA